MSKFWMLEIKMHCILLSRSPDCKNPMMELKDSLARCIFAVKVSQPCRIGNSESIWKFSNFLVQSIGAEVWCISWPFLVVIDAFPITVISRTQDQEPRGEPWFFRGRFTSHQNTNANFHFSLWPPHTSASAPHSWFSKVGLFSAAVALLTVATPWHHLYVSVRFLLLELLGQNKFWHRFYFIPFLFLISVCC